MVFLNHFTILCIHVYPPIMDTIDIHRWPFAIIRRFPPPFPQPFPNHSYHRYYRCHIYTIDNYIGSLSHPPFPSISSNPIQASNSACSSFTCICAWSRCRETCATSSRSCARRPCRCSTVPLPAWNGRTVLGWGHWTWGTWDGKGWWLVIFWWKMMENDGKRWKMMEYEEKNLCVFFFLKWQMGEFEMETLMVW